MERIRHRIRVYLATTCSLPAEAYRSPKSYHPPIRERRNNRMTHTIFLVQELKDGKTVNSFTRLNVWVVQEFV
jgi:hypothetical protein